MPDNEISTAYDLFLHDLRAILYMERQLEDELENMAAEVTNEKLSDALREHRQETEEQAQRIRDIFGILGEDSEVHEAADYSGMFQEVNHLNEDITDTDLLDLAFLNAAIKVERIEITAYEGLLKMAENLEIDMDDEDIDQVEDLLEDNLESEKDALKELQTIMAGSWLEKMIRRLMP